MNTATTTDYKTLYVNLKSIAEVQVTLQNVPGCWTEDLAQDVVTHLIVETKIQELPRKSPLFWWNYVFSALSSTAKQLVYNNEEIKKVCKCLYENQLVLDNSTTDFIKIKPRKLEKLFREGTVFEYASLASKVDPVVGRSLKYSINRYLKSGKTEVLIKAYDTLRKRFHREFKSCRDTLNERFLRTPPSKRTSY